MTVVVVGVGNAYRGDDTAGLLAAEHVRVRAGSAVQVRAVEQEPSRLVDSWTGADAAYVVDAVASGAPPGTVHRYDAADGPLPVKVFGSSSTHALGVADAVELARALDRLPPLTVVFGIEGERFGAGEEVTPAVAAAAAAVADEILSEVGRA
jgi:hydrogenase maturation protease